MDWMDEYLYSMGQYRTTVSPADTHIWGVKPTPNAQQKRMLFDAAAQSELEYRLLVQESRQSEIDAGMGGEYDTGSAAREGPVSPAPAPSGIPVSTTNIAITYNGQTRNLEKISDTSWYNPQGGQNDSGACEITRFALQYANSRWEFSTYFNTLDEGNCSTGGLELQSTNAGASSSIPVSDWSTSITITTAPSGIVVATANAIVLSGITGVYSDLNGTYTKSGDPTSVTAGGVEGEATGAVFFNSAYTGGNKNGAAIWYGPIPYTNFTGWAITYENDNRFVAGFIASSRTTEVPVSGYSNTVGYTGTITLTAA